MEFFLVYRKQDRMNPKYFHIICKQRFFYLSGKAGAPEARGH